MRPRLAMLARASNRGLGIQTLSFYEHMKPDRVLVVDMGRDRDPLAMQPDRYPDAWDVASPERLTGAEIRSFLEGIDVLYSAETFYNDAVAEIAREMGVRTVLHGNWEFLGYVRDPQRPRPDLFLAPSPWRFEAWPEPKELLPFPVDRERFPFRHRTEAKTFLHVAGWPTNADRNGTWSFLHALRHVHMPMRVIVTTQHELPTSLTDYRNLPAVVELDVRLGDVPDNRALYEEADVLVLPRRFGGLSLVLNEAASLGLAVLALDRHPENSWIPPEGLIPCCDHATIEAQSEPITIVAGDDAHLAARMQGLMTDPETVSLLSKASDAWAESISWDRLRPAFDSMLARLCA